MKELLERLCSAFGPSGLEMSVHDIIKSELEKTMPTGAELFEDKLGGIYLHIKNEGAPRLMLCAHMDEVGFMVTEITDAGTLKFGCVGGINPLVLPSKRVISENGIRGAIATKPIHLLSADERKTRTEIKDMRIDIGAQDKQNASEHVSIGDYFTFDSEVCYLGENQIKAKALDDRHGCVAMLATIKRLAKEKVQSNYDLYFAFTTREEIGVSGAWCATELIKPDYAVVIESKAVLDLVSVDEDRQVGALGEGALISYVDNGAIMDRALTDKLIDLCKKNEIKYQINKAVSGGNDSGAIQKGAYGARVALVSAPSRYIHSSGSVVDLRDLTAIQDLIYALTVERR